jgi:hypothetical protein
MRNDDDCCRDPVGRMYMLVDSIVVPHGNGRQPFGDDETYGDLQNDLTIDDPQRFSHPWQISIRYKRVTDVNRMIATNCTENDRDETVNGKQTIVPP